MRLIVFLSVFVLVTGLVFLDVGMSLIPGLSDSRQIQKGCWIFLVVLMLLIWMIPLVHWRRDDVGRKRMDLIFLQASYLSAGLVSFLFVFSLIADGMNHLLKKPYTVNSMSVLLATLVSFILGVVGALRKPRVKKVKVPFGGLPRDLVGFKIAQITDLHVGPTVRRRFVKRVVDIVNGLGADLVAVTGDMVDGTLEQLKDQIQPLKELRAQKGVYYVTGNHEYYWGVHQWVAEFERLGFIPLMNSSKVLRLGSTEFAIGGVIDYAASLVEKNAKADAGLAVHGLPPEMFKILLAHQPGNAPEASGAGFSLQLSGHTHGGQFFPWTFVAKLFHKYYVGLNRCGGMWVYISRGTGTWGPPIRLGSRSEITLLELCSG